MAEKPIMSSRRRRRRRRIAPIHQGAASIVSNREVQRPREEECLPRLRYNEDFHSREEKGGGGGLLFEGRMKSLPGQIFSACVEKLSAREGCFIHGQPRVSRERDGRTTRRHAGQTGTARMDRMDSPANRGGSSCVFNNSGGFRKAGWLIPYWLIKIPHFSNLFYNYIRIGFVYSEPIQRSCLKYV